MPSKRLAKLKRQAKARVSSMKERIRNDGSRSPSRREQLKNADSDDVRRILGRTKRTIERAGAGVAASGAEAEVLGDGRRARRKSPSEMAREQAEMGPPIDATLEPTTAPQETLKLAGGMGVGSRGGGRGPEPMGMDIAFEPVGMGVGMEPSAPMVDVGMGGGAAGGEKGAESSDDPLVFEDTFDLGGDL